MMTMEQVVCHGRNLASLADQAIKLRSDAQTYRALGKVALADLLDAEAADWEDRARKMLRPDRAKVVVNMQMDGKAVRNSLLELKRRRGGGELGLA